MTARMLWALWARRFKCAFPDGPTEPIPSWVQGCEVSEREACSLQLAAGVRPPVCSVGASAVQTVAGRLALPAGATAVSGV